MKYICVANCPELNDAQHCTCVDIKDVYERYVDGCPCGNKPIWKEMIQENTQFNSSHVPQASVKKEPNVDIHTAWRDGYDAGAFEAIMNLTGGHKCKHAAAVIYCRDCKFFREYSDEYKSNVENAVGNCYILLMNSDNKQLIAKSEDDYCSYAKLKED